MIRGPAQSAAPLPAWSARSYRDIFLTARKSCIINQDRALLIYRAPTSVISQLAPIW